MLPKLLGRPSDNDTQFTAMMKKHQDFVLIGGIFLLIIIAISIYSSTSSGATGTWRYGVCKVFLERYQQYPDHLKILTAGEKQSSAQIGYLATNAYGMRQSGLLECFYSTSNGVQLSKVTLDRKPLPDDMVEIFNKTIPVVLAQEDLDLTLPPSLPNTMAGLKFE